MGKIILFCGFVEKCGFFQEEINRTSESGNIFSNLLLDTSSI